MQRGPTLPGVEADEEDRIVLHVDLDCFYAACERLREPDLSGEPVVVGMGYEPGDRVGAVATASYEAREHGVESAQAISTALERLPRAADRPDDESGDGSSFDPVGHYRPVDMEYYESVAADVKEILHDVADVVREVSIDEAYLDVTELTDWSVAEGYARHVKQRIEREVGLVASVGAAPTMHAAKVASDHDKPDGLVVVEPGEVREFLAPLPVDDLHGIGPVTARELRERDVETVAELADADREWIRDRWGDRGLELQDRARGVDPRVVEPRGRPKSLSRESAFAEPEDDVSAVRERARALADAVADRARSKEAMYRTIGVKVVLPPYDVNTRERSLSGPVDDPGLVEDVALDLLAEFDDESPRKVGVRVSNLAFEAADQSTLGGWEGETEDGDGAASVDRSSDETASSDRPGDEASADATPADDGDVEGPLEGFRDAAEDVRDATEDVGGATEDARDAADGSAGSARGLARFVDESGDAGSGTAGSTTIPTAASTTTQSDASTDAGASGDPTEASLDAWTAPDDSGDDPGDGPGVDPGDGLGEAREVDDAASDAPLPPPATDALPAEQTTLSDFA